MPAEESGLESAVLVLTPSGRDASLVVRALGDAGFGAVVCETGEELAARIAAGAGTALVAQEALTPAIVARLAHVLGTQRPWSDFPLLIFMERAATPRENQLALETFDVLGNVTALERPLHMRTMISGVRAALRARARQYAARAALQERERDVRQRDQFLAMLGHELRNPLGAVSNAAHLLQRRGVAAELARPVTVIERQIQHLTRLVDDLLDVARVTTGKITLKRAPTDFNAVCGGLIDESLRASRERGLELAFQGPTDPILVLGDRVRLEQVVNNLLTNALKYTPAGGRVTVSLAVALEDGEAELRVVDTGMGIDASAIRGIFEPFTQSERTLDRAQGGMGLGLSVVRTIVRLHGGSVMATSPGLGHGTTFTVRLPLAAEERARAEEEPTPLEAPATAALRIVIIEDSAENRETLQDLLEDLGHEVHVAVDGIEGVERTLAVRPQVALVDIGLPLIDGFEVARRVRAAIGSETFLLALTGYGQPEDRARAAAAGFDAHLTKPVDLDALERMLGARDARPRDGSAARQGHA